MCLRAGSKVDFIYLPWNKTKWIILSTTATTKTISYYYETWVNIDIDSKFLPTMNENQASY